MQPVASSARLVASAIARMRPLLRLSPVATVRWGGTAPATRGARARSVALVHSETPRQRPARKVLLARYAVRVVTKMGRERQCAWLVALVSTATMLLRRPQNLPRVRLVVERCRALEVCEWEGSPPPLWARRGVGSHDSLLGEDVGCPSRREPRLPEPTPASFCAPRNADLAAGAGQSA